MANIKKIICLLSKIDNLKLWIGLLIFLAILGSLFGLGMGHGLRVMIEFSTEGNWQIAQTGLILFVLFAMLARQHLPKICPGSLHFSCLFFSGIHQVVVSQQQ